MTGIFLTAEWRWLLMLNYECDATTLRRHVPYGTELDSRDGVHYISVVGFRFINTRVRGLTIPLHRDFDEVNLRFYVRRRGEDGWQRGVVFIKELVPRRAIATMARVVYGENYQAMPMRHSIAPPTEHDSGVISYEWRHHGVWNGLCAKFVGHCAPLTPGSFEEFIAEHYWGYAKQGDGTSIEYRVDHAPWRVWNTTSAELQCDAALLYGKSFAEPLSRPPCSAFVADGSAVSVLMGRRLCPEKVSSQAD